MYSRVSRTLGLSGTGSPHFVSSRRAPSRRKSSKSYTTGSASFTELFRTFRKRSGANQRLSALFTAMILTRSRLCNFTQERQNEPELWIQKFGLHGTDSSYAYSRNSARRRRIGLERDYGEHNRCPAAFRPGAF